MACTVLKDRAAGWPDPEVRRAGGHVPGARHLARHFQSPAIVLMRIWER